MLRSVEERNQLFMENQGLIHYVMEEKLSGYWKGKTSHNNYSFEDIQQVVSMGLLKACEQYNPIEYGHVKFSTYAVPKMEGEWRHWARERTTSIRFSRTIRGFYSKIYKESAFDKTIAEIAIDTGLTEKEVTQAVDFRNNMTIFSTDRLINENDDNPKETIELFTGIDADYTGINVEQFMDKLDDKERYIVECLLADQTQGQIAKVLGCSQVQVGRIINKRIKLKARAFFQMETA